MQLQCFCFLSETMQHQALGRRDRTSFETNSICYHNSRGIDPDSDSLVEKRKFNNNNNCSDMDGSAIA